MLAIHPLIAENREWFITSLQQAFRQAFQNQLEKNEEIITRQEIESCMQSEQAECLQIESNGKPVGGAVVTIAPQTQHNALKCSLCTQPNMAKASASRRGS